MTPSGVDHCRKIDKEYAKAARILGDLDDPLYLAKVDASKNPALVKKYNIRQFPSILFIRNGIAVEYNWGLKADDFVDFMKEKAGPIAETYPTVKALKEALKSSDFAVVGSLQEHEVDEYQAVGERDPSPRRGACDLHHQRLHRRSHGREGPVDCLLLPR